MSSRWATAWPSRSAPSPNPERRRATSGPTGAADRRVRRPRGKSDPIDAENAARAVLAGTAVEVCRRPVACRAACAVVLARAHREALVVARRREAGHVGVLAARGPGLLHGLGQGGCQVDDPPRLRFRRMKRRRLAVLPLGLDDLRERLRAAVVGERLAGAPTRDRRVPGCRTQAGHVIRFSRALAGGFGLEALALSGVGVG